MNDSDDIPPEVDFSGGVRGKYADRYAATEETGNVNGFDVVAFSDRCDKGYRVKLPTQPYEITIYQEFADGVWWGPAIRMYAPDGPAYPEEGRDYAVLLLGVVASMFASMLLKPDAPVTLARFDPLWDADEYQPKPEVKSDDDKPASAAE